LHSQALGSGLNPRGVLDFSPLYFFSKRKMAEELQKALEGIEPIQNG